MARTDSFVFGNTSPELLYAQLVEGPAADVVVSTSAPTPLTAVSPREHATAVVGMKIDCAHWGARSEWPSTRTTVTIGLAGFDAPASYSFTELFGTETAGQIREMCAQA